MKSKIRVILLATLSLTYVCLVGSGQSREAGRAKIVGPRGTE